MLVPSLLRPDKKMPSVDLATIYFNYSKNDADWLVHPLKSRRTNQREESSYFRKMLGVLFGNDEIYVYFLQFSF